MANATIPTAHPERRAATTASIMLAFASVYFFWGSTYTAIRIGAAEMPALLLAGTRYVIAGAVLLAWCRWRGLRLLGSTRSMFTLSLIGLLLLGGGNVSLVYAEKTLPSGLSSLLFAATPLYVTLIEMLLPRGEQLSIRGWLGLCLGFAGLAALTVPSIASGLHGDSAVIWAVAVLLFGALSWAVGSVVSRRARLPLHSLVAAAWQMLVAGVCCTALGTALGQWPQFHLNANSVGSLAYLVTGGSLLGYTCFIYLLEHVPVAKVSSNAYVNPLVAVLIGILFLHERPRAAEFAGMAAIVIAVFLLTTASVKAKASTAPVEQFEQVPAE
jgi:drug/metabolite transporter (DMT)-like permease